MKLIIEENGKRKVIEPTTVTYGSSSDEQDKLEEFEKKMADEVSDYLNKVKGQRN